LREQAIEFSKSYERLTPHYGDVKGAVAAGESQNAFDQTLAFIVGKRSERPDLMQVFGLVSITTRTAKRAFASDLD
jgi:hypothetical protein